MHRLGHTVCVATIISGGMWTVLALNLLGQARVTNQRISESLHNDSPCRWWLHLFQKLNNDMQQAISGVTVLLMNSIDSGFRQFQHTSKFVGFHSHVKYFTHHIWNIIMTQNSVFEHVSRCKRKAKNSMPSCSPVAKFSELKRVAQTIYTSNTFSQVSTLDIKPVILYLCHKCGAGWKEETTNQIEQLWSVYTNRAGRRKNWLCTTPGYGCECTCATTFNPTNSDIYKRVKESTWPIILFVALLRARTGKSQPCRRERELQQAMSRVSVVCLLLGLAALSYSCQPPDCDHPDCWTCGELRRIPPSLTLSRWY